MVSAEQVHKWCNVPNSRFVPCNSSQLKLMKLYPQAQYNVETLPDYREKIDQLGEAGLGWAWIGDGRVLAMFGVAPYWDGLAEGWLMVDTHGIHKRKMQLTKGTRRFFNNIGPALGLRRIQIMVSVAHKEAVAWSRLLGFEYEATLKKYGPDGSDHLVFARFYDESI